MIPFEDLGKFMNKEQIESWAKLGESETLEFKRSTGERKEATKTICAMLNNRGGRVLFGIEPSGKIIGQDVSDHTVEEVAQELKNIEPPVFPNIDSHEKLPEVSDRQIREDLATLQTLGLAYSYGHGRGAGWKSHL